MTPASSPLSRLLSQAWADLQPFAGRFGLTWRVALLCAIVTAAAMMFKIPEASISCYLIIFLMKEDAVQNCLMGFGLILLATLVVVLMIPVINLSIDSPAMRLAIMFGVSYVFLFLSSTTPLGEQAAIVGLIVAFIMTLVTDVPIGQIGNQGLLAAWKMACMPMALMILFNLVLGIPAQTLVRNRIVRRLRASADVLENPEAGEELQELLAEGNDLSLQQMLTVKLLHLISKEKSTWLNGAVETSYRVMLASLAPAGSIAPERARALAGELRQAADEIASGNTPAAPAPEDATDDSAAARKLSEALAALSQPDGGASPKPAPQRLLSADAFTNPDHQRYALKTSLAAIICYLIYTGIQWDGIHTALITCYVAALGTTGETVRKLTLRIVGCLIGAAMGVGALLFIMPHLTSIGGLMILVFAGTLVGAWVSSGNERISYSGVQIALAFLLTTLNGFGPSFEFSQAGDRIMGIFVGIFVIYVIFTQFWPKSVVNEVRDTLDRVSGDLKSLAGETKDRRDSDLAISMRAFGDLEHADEMLDMAYFEPRSERAPNEQLDGYRVTLEEMRSRLCGLQARA
ncbi:FUSC family protein [Nitratireductor aquimarinus]|uniref:FUSC family protein n=1 Tax=Nitratireductor aquimarinus TaxID=889300 RepID=UPI001A8DC418|nr:FUSC family protein [Nitratireductor aquimarinus]MBN8242478.1 FUSC family protein [Nitratireductor aquimarinus]MBY6130865.1 FUSC family protein [Nitratireductor aquimarinus]MCA1302380.1 FUSC family protein [Nitratireductor aquimarinus]